MTPAPTVLVLRHARVLSPAGAARRGIGVIPTDAAPCDLVDALTSAWPTDAHAVAYEPRAVGAADGSVIYPRLSREAVGDPAIGPISMVAMIGDVDPPGHVWTKEWWTATEPLLESTGLAWYRTRNGARVVATLEEPVAICTRADEQAWSDRVLGWREYLLAGHGLEIDERCHDWTRIFRLPNVVRGGRVERSELRGVLRPWRTTEWITPAEDAPSAPPTVTTTAAPAFDRALAIAARMPASVEGLGGDAALFAVTREIAAQVGPDADAIEAALGVFSARCLPPWPPEKLRYEAERASQEQATPEAQYARRLLERAAVATTAPVDDTADPWHRAYDWTAPEEPVPYLCEGLRLAPSRGKISLIAGAPGGAKGPLADHLAACFALGEPVFGEHAVERSRVILVDCEGLALTTKRIRRLVRALGRQAHELGEWLYPVDASTLGDLSAVSNLLALEERVRALNARVVVLDSYTTAMLASGVDANSPQFAQLAQRLGCLGVLVIAVAHARKIDAGEEPQLVDVAYSGAVAALAQTAIATSRPDPADEYRIRVTCARAPETRFLPIEVRFGDDPDGGLSVTRIGAPATPPPENPRVVRECARVGTLADDVERVLREVDTVRAGMAAGKIRRHLAIASRDWSPVLAELRRRGTVIEGSNPALPGVLLRLTERT